MPLSAPCLLLDRDGDEGDGCVRLHLCCSPRAAGWDQEGDVSASSEARLFRIRPLEKHQPGHRTDVGLPVRYFAPQALLDIFSHLKTTLCSTQSIDGRKVLNIGRTRSGQVDVPDLHDRIWIAGRRACLRPRSAATELMLAEYRRLRVPPNPCWG